MLTSALLDAEKFVVTISAFYSDGILHAAGRFLLFRHGQAQDQMRRRIPRPAPGAYRHERFGQPIRSSLTILTSRIE